MSLLLRTANIISKMKQYTMKIKDKTNKKLLIASGNSLIVERDKT